MTKGIFCHDLPIYKDINGNYCSTTLTNDLFSRYFVAVDELVVATRVYPLQTDYETAHQELISLEGLSFLDLPNVNALTGPFREVPTTRKLLSAAFDDVDLAFIRGGLVACLGVTQAKKHNIPYLLESAGSAWDSYWNHSAIGKVVAPYFEFRAKKDTRDASYVIYVTEKWLQKKYPTNGVSTFASNVMLNKADSTVLQKRLEKICSTGKEKTEYVVGTTAAIDNKAKGQRFMIEAMAKLKGDFNIRYELVGHGDPENLMKTAEKYNLSDSVVFKGEMTHKEVFSWLDSIDLYVQPSLQEGLPRSLIEAMSRACPAVGSNIAGIPELLGKDALFRKGDSGSLAETLAAVLSGDLTKYAKDNFYKSAEYEINVLNERRSEIYRQYRDYVEKQKG